MQSPRETSSNWAVVLPVKGGWRAKSRWWRATHSTDRPWSRAQTGELAQAMARDTCAVSATTVGASRVVVVTADPVTADWATEAGYAVVSDPLAGLNEAAAVGAQWAWRQLRPRGVAVLLADHPGLTREDLQEALAAAGRHDRAFLPDADGTGSAVVTSQLPGRWLSAFGPGSCAAHRREGLHELPALSPGLRQDVDLPSDLRRLPVDRLGPHTVEVWRRYA